MDVLIEGMKGGISSMKKSFRNSVEIMKGVEYDRSVLKPTVLIVGEYLLNFHPGANREIERYLEKNGFEIIEAKMADVIQKTYYAQDRQIIENKLTRPVSQKAMLHATATVFELTHKWTDDIAQSHPLYEKPPRLGQLAEESDDIIYHTFDAGEGILIPAEIIYQAKHGCKNFIILQPFGCLPNHIIGRGITKRLKEMFPEAQILPLDYDPDVSFANLENRLQMMVMSAMN